ncbi:MAG: ATPase [Rickettsiaceae bacterium]|jgi:K+-transporting ATPase ATPase A chain|nr:ATPase [Rickettsiaceae bacterium]
MLVSLIIYFIVLSISAPLLGKYIAYVYSNKKIKLLKPLYSTETLFLRLLDNPVQQSWTSYFKSLMSFNILCLVVTFIILYYQNYLWFDRALPLNIPATINAATSFVTNTFWQSHDAERELNYASHILALMLQNFLSAGTGIAVFIAFTRSMNNERSPFIGNFYADFLKAQIYLLLPFSFLIAVILIWQGVPHEFTKIIAFKNLENINSDLTIGPAAGQVAIKIFASNGGSIFNAASAHPFENPTEIAMLIQLMLILLLPVSLVFTYGYIVDNIKLSWTLYSMIVFFIALSFFLTYYAENKYGFTYFLNKSPSQDSFNILGKESLQEKTPAILWTTLATATSLGSQNSIIDNYSPLSIFSLLGNLIIGKFILDSVASGFFTMLIYIIITVFIRGLIVGQPPTFLGKKISIKEINYIIISSLIFPIGVVLFISISLALPITSDLINQHGPRAISALAFNFSSLFSNNGAAMIGININNDWFNVLGALAMLIGRFPTIYFALAVAGSFAEKIRIVDNTNINTSGLEFCVLLSFMIFLMGALTFFPVLLLGPVLEFVNLLSITE